MTTFDPDTIRHDSRVLSEIIQKFDGRLALNSWVIQGGEIRVGDDAEVLMSDNLMSKQTTLNEFGN